MSAQDCMAVNAFLLVLEAAARAHAHSDPCDFLRNEYSAEIKQTLCLDK